MSTVLHGPVTRTPYGLDWRGHIARPPAAVARTSVGTRRHAAVFFASRRLTSSDEHEGEGDSRFVSLA